MNEDIFLIAAIFSCNKYQSLFAEKYEILKLEWSQVGYWVLIEHELWEMYLKMLGLPIILWISTYKCNQKCENIMVKKTPVHFKG